PPGNLRRAQTGGEDRDVRRINLDTRTGAQSHALMRGRLRDSRDGLAHVLCSPGKDGIEERAGEKARVKLVVAVDARGFRNPRGNSWFQLTGLAGGQCLNVEVFGFDVVDELA